MAKTARGGAPAPRSSQKTTTRPADAARIQSAIAPQHGGGIRKGSYVGRMQRSAAKNSN